MKGFCSTISSQQCIEPKAIKPTIYNKSVWYSKLAVSKALTRKEFQLTWPVDSARSRHYFL